MSRGGRRHFDVDGSATFRQRTAFAPVIVIVQRYSGAVEDSLAGDLLRHLYDAFHDRPRGDVCWVMNHSWFMEIRKMDHRGVGPVWEPSLAISGLDLLFGIPVVVHKDHGVPRLVPSEVVTVHNAAPGVIAFFRVYRGGRLRC